MNKCHGIVTELHGFHGLYIKIKLTTFTNLLFPTHSYLQIIIIIIMVESKCTRTSTKENHRPGAPYIVIILEHLGHQSYSYLKSINTTINPRYKFFRT